jgi:hypothetical protein
MHSLLKSTTLGKAHPVGVANPVCLKIGRAVADALAEATAVAGVAADAIDPLPICFTVYDALDGEVDLAIQRVASAAAYLAVERHLDAITAPTAAE